MFMKYFVEFWYQVKGEYPQLYEKAVNILLPFLLTYLHKTGFSSSTLSIVTNHNSLNSDVI